MTKLVHVGSSGSSDQCDQDHHWSVCEFRYLHCLDDQTGAHGIIRIVRPLWPRSSLNWSACASALTYHLHWSYFSTGQRRQSSSSHWSDDRQCEPARLIFNFLRLERLDGKIVLLHLFLFGISEYSYTMGYSFGIDPNLTRARLPALQLLRNCNGLMIGPVWSVQVGSSE